jgi:sulfur relay (sulfurtransferase) complex TusBCD TusD component (DsrE family)
MGKGCLAIPQEVGGLTRNGGVRVTVCISCTYARPMETYPLDQFIRAIRFFADLRGQIIPI